MCRRLIIIIICFSVSTITAFLAGQEHHHFAKYAWQPQGGGGQVGWQPQGGGTQVGWQPQGGGGQGQEGGVEDKFDKETSIRTLIHSHR